MLNQELLLKVNSFPKKPGVYLFKDFEEKIIYIGKAKNLRKRVKSYFQINNTETKIKRINEQAQSIEFITTKSETDALILENNLIKIHKPTLNVRLKDDKTYPFLKITISEQIPRVEITRKREEDSEDLFFGPFSDVKSLRLALKKALTIFPIARCKKEIQYGKAERSCLYFQLDRCLAPCSGEVNLESYRKTVNQFIRLFEGKQYELLEEIKDEMEKASEDLNFEKAALLRDKLQVLKRIVAKQTIVSKNTKAEYDIIGIVKAENTALIQILVLRKGRIVEQKHFIISLPYDTRDEDILAAFIEQYYSKTDFIPEKILIKSKVPNEQLINNWLNSKRNNSIEKRILIQPKSDEEETFVNLAYDNAKSNLNTMIRFEITKTKRAQISLKELKNALELEKIPHRIEGYDISTLQGKDTVGSCVVFENGLPKKSDYRKFIIKTVKEQNDFASLGEVIRRRFTGSLAKKEKNPDLILIDGGKGQVSHVLMELEKIGIEIPMIGLSKEYEEIHFINDRESLKLDEKSEALKLLQRIRDEAHRFALSFHKKRRSKRMLKSSLEKIPEIGPKRIKLLYDKFGDLKSIKGATIEELETVPGISKRLAKKIKDYYINSLDIS